MATDNEMLGQQRVVCLMGDAVMFKNLCLVFKEERSRVMSLIWEMTIQVEDD